MKTCNTCAHYDVCRSWTQPQYLSESDVYSLLGERGMATVHCSQIDVLPRADVAPRAEVNEAYWEGVEYGNKDGAALVAREIFEEIEKHGRKMQSSDFSGDFWDIAVLMSDIAELKKKYTQPEPPKGD